MGEWEISIKCQEAVLEIMERFIIVSLSETYVVKLICKSYIFYVISGIFLKRRAHLGFYCWRESSWKSEEPLLIFFMAVRVGIIKKSFIDLSGVLSSYSFYFFVEPKLENLGNWLTLLTGEIWVQQLWTLSSVEDKG